MDVCIYIYAYIHTSVCVYFYIIYVWGMCCPMHGPDIRKEGAPSAPLHSCSVLGVRVIHWEEGASSVRRFSGEALGEDRLLLGSS